MKSVWYNTQIALYPLNILKNDELLLPVINCINKKFHFHIVKWPLTSRSKLRWKRVKGAAVIDLSVIYWNDLLEIKKKKSIKLQ